MVLLQLGKEIQTENIGELTSSSPDIGSGESSLSNGHSLSDVISDWKRELEEKNCELRDKTLLIQTLENELSDVRDRCKSVELDRDKNCQMVRIFFFLSKSIVKSKNCRITSLVILFLCIKRCISA